MKGILVALPMVLASMACASPPSGERRIYTAPDEAGFREVHEAMLHNCGTLDCHGSTHRNFRIYGATGLRLAPEDIPGQGNSTDEEIHRTYRSLIGLEPLILEEVVQGRRAVDALTWVRKARGLEAHTAGAVFRVGSVGDRCVIAWLTGGADVEACAIASE